MALKKQTTNPPASTNGKATLQNMILELENAQNQSLSGPLTEEEIKAIQQYGTLIPGIK